VEIINGNVENVQVGGTWGCVIACAGACLITSGSLTAIVLAVMVMD